MIPSIIRRHGARGAGPVRRLLMLCTVLSVVGVGIAACGGDAGQNKQTGVLSQISVRGYDRVATISNSDGSAANNGAESVFIGLPTKFSRSLILAPTSLLLEVAAMASQIPTNGVIPLAGGSWSGDCQVGISQQTSGAADLGSYGLSNSQIGQLKSGSVELIVVVVDCS